MLAIWLPSVFLGVVANRRTDIPAIRRSKIEARATMAAAGASLPVERRGDCAHQAAGDDVVLRLVEGYAPVWLASLLAPRSWRHHGERLADFALSTMFTGRRVCVL